MVYLLKQEVFIMPKKVLNIDNEILDLLNRSEERRVGKECRL